MRVFLGDLFHTGSVGGISTMPINIGYVAEYVKKHFGNNIEFRLFKSPEVMIDAIKENSPDVIGLSFYVWNTNLNQRIFQIARQVDPGVLTIGGGPAFTSQNANIDGAMKFFTRQPECDAFVVNQGERGMLMLLERFYEVGQDRSVFMEGPVAGALVNDIARSKTCHISSPLDPLSDLDEIPSPYLSGVLDEFFAEPIIPIIETNRSCPYRCTFCAWGIGTQKLARFSPDRVLSEIDYISDRCTKTSNMYIADANFGILERDITFAKRIYERHLDSGYPGHVMVQWNKTRPDRVVRVAQEFRGISEIGASMQSLSPTVQGAIKRKNLPLDAVVDMNRTLNEQGQGGQLFSELILGLPEETWESHIDGNKKLIDAGAEVFNYNLHLLPGTEMDTPETRERYFKKTAWRLHDNSFGRYDGVLVFEGQEVVIETSTMSEGELRSFRFIHFLLQFMWGRKWYFDYLSLLRIKGVHPVDTILQIADEFEHDKGPMGSILAEFRSDHSLESFDTFEALSEYWSSDSAFERLVSGDYGKLNYLYTFKLLLENGDEFNSFLLNVTRNIAEKYDFEDTDGFMEVCSDVLHFSEYVRLSLSKDHQLVETKRATFSFDILKWRQGSRDKLPTRSASLEYEFYLTEPQRQALNRQLKQFEAENINATLRRMSQDTSADQFFYQIRPYEAPAKATPTTMRPEV